MKYECSACKNTLDSDFAEAEAKAEYERTYGRPFKPENVAIVCEDCAGGISYTCDLCGGRFMSTPAWSEAHAVAEFEAMFGAPLDPKNSAVLCDDCYKMAMAEMFPASHASH